MSILRNANVALSILGVKGDTGTWSDLYTCVNGHLDVTSMMITGSTADCPFTQVYVNSSTCVEDDFPLVFLVEQVLGLLIISAI